MPTCRVSWPQRLVPALPTADATATDVATTCALAPPAPAASGTIAGCSALVGLSRERGGRSATAARAAGVFTRKLDASGHRRWPRVVGRLGARQRRRERHRGLRHEGVGRRGQRHPLSRRRRRRAAAHRRRPPPLGTPLGPRRARRRQRRWLRVRPLRERPPRRRPVVVGIDSEGGARHVQPFRQAAVATHRQGHDGRRRQARERIGRRLHGRRPGGRLSRAVFRADPPDRGQAHGQRQASLDQTLERAARLRQGGQAWGRGLCGSTRLVVVGEVAPTTWSHLAGVPWLRR